MTKKKKKKDHYKEDHDIVKLIVDAGPRDREHMRELVVDAGPRDRKSLEDDENDEDNEEEG